MIRRTSFACSFTACRESASQRDRSVPHRPRGRPTQRLKNPHAQYHLRDRPCPVLTAIGRPDSLGNSWWGPIPRRGSVRSRTSSGRSVLSVGCSPFLLVAPTTAPSSSQASAVRASRSCCPASGPGLLASEPGVPSETRPDGRLEHAPSASLGVEGPRPSNFNLTSASLRRGPAAACTTVQRFAWWSQFPPAMVTTSLARLDHDGHDALCPLRSDIFVAEPGSSRPRSSAWLGGWAVPSRKPGRELSSPSSCRRDPTALYRVDPAEQGLAVFEVVEAQALGRSRLRTFHVAGQVRR